MPEDRKDIYVLDTNALINEPEIIRSFPGAEVIIPQVVLTELDHLKVSRTADADRRFRGREVSRLLFELSNEGVLAEGVQTGDSVVRVAVFQKLEDVPANLNLKNPDDQIIAVANQLHRDGSRVTVVTNDLNMLVKAQTIGLDVMRVEEPAAPTAKRRRNLRSLFYSIAGVLMLSIIFTVGYLFYLDVRERAPVPATVNKNAATSFHVNEYNLKAHIAANPKDYGAIVGLANLYYDNKRYGDAVNWYRRAISVQPQDLNVRTDMATALFRLGLNDEALKEYDAVLSINPSFANAVLNKGVLLMQTGKRREAAVYFKHYLKLEPTGEKATKVKQLLAEAEAAGR